MMEVTVEEAAGLTRLMDTLSVCLSPGTCTETAVRTTGQATPWGSTTDRRGSSDTGSWEAPCLYSPKE